LYVVSKDLNNNTITVSETTTVRQEE
jgi:hypothetical protein